MRIIIAPAKKMVVDTDSFAVDGLPCAESGLQGVQQGYRFCRSVPVGNHTVYLWVQSPKD